MARKPVHQPWHPAPWKPEDAYALQALAKGIASEGQQKRALDWIIRCAGTYEPTFFVGQQDATNFAEGSRYVGLQVVKLVNMPAAVIGKMNESK
jgi:hypothetical protein